ncbi:MAG: hypothetical protein VCC99_00380 [Alphaproteobacteria bacterium]
MWKLFCSCLAIGAVAAFAFGGAAQAGEAKISGLYPAVPNDSSVVAKDDGSSVVVFDLKGMLAVADTSNPWHNAIMDCNGIGAYDPDGTIKTEGGTCMITDADGDVQRLPWETTSPEGGVWAIAGGTGKFADMTGSGTWVAVSLDDGRLQNTWTFTQITPDVTN